MNDDDIMQALVHQVSRATPKARTELAVVTVITRPMWNSFCRASNMPEDCDPTDWIGKGTRRVYGSETIVVESDQMASVSFAV